MLRTKTVMGVLLIAGLVLAGVGTALAQEVHSPYSVAYYNGGFTPATANNADGAVRVINSGYTGGTIWANIYVFDPQQEFKECCSCPVSPNGISHISLHALTNNPWNGVYSSTGVIKVIASTSGDPASPTPLVYELRSWILNINNVPTEERFVSTPLSEFELVELEQACSSLANQSGAGTCQSACPAEFN